VIESQLVHKFKAMTADYRKMAEALPYGQIHCSLGGLTSSEFLTIDSRRRLMQALIKKSGQQNCSSSGRQTNLTNRTASNTYTVRYSKN
jgi:hypothetical protein